MASIKQFDLAGVGSSVQFGKGGTQINSASGAFNMQNAAQSALVNVRVLDPVIASDAATKLYVDNAIQGLDVKSEAQVATTANITLSGLQTIDGYTTLADDRVLVKNQTDATQNGIYIAATGAWARAADASTGAELASAFVFVRNGTSEANTGWTQTTNPPITIGTSPIVWAQFSGAGSYMAGSGLTLTGGTFSVNTDGVTTFINSNNVAVKSSATAGQVLLSAGSGAAAWGAVSLSTPAAITGTLPVGHGGTGAVSFDAKSVLIGNGTSAISDITGTAGQVLLLDGSANPSFGNIDLSTSAAVGSTILGLSNGGTNAALTATAGGIVYGTGTALAVTAAGTSGQVILSGGAGAPTYANIASIAVTGAANEGGGTGFFMSDVSGTLEFKTLTSTGSSMTISNTSNTVNIEVNQSDLNLNNLSGTLAVAGGGTGRTTLTLGSILVGNGTSPMTETALSSDATTLIGENFAGMVASLGLTIGTYTQAYNASLAALSSLAGNGILVYTGSNTFAERAITVSGAGNLAGLAITNGDGVAAAPNLGLDINGLAAAGALDDTNALPMFDGTNNVKVTIAEIAAKVLADYPVDPLFAYGTVSGYANGNIASMHALPTNARVLRVMVNVSAAYTAGANMQILDASGDILADVSDIDAQTIGIYMVELTGMDFTSAGNVKVAFTGTTATVGAATVSVDYRILA